MDVLLAIFWTAVAIMWTIVAYSSGGPWAISAALASAGATLFWVTVMERRM